MHICIYVYINHAYIDVYGFKLFIIYSCKAGGGVLSTLGNLRTKRGHRESGRTQTHTYTHTRTRARTHTHTHTHTRVRVRALAHRHIHTHTYTPVCRYRRNGYVGWVLGLSPCQQFQETFLDAKELLLIMFSVSIIHVMTYYCALLLCVMIVCLITSNNMI